MGPDGAWWAGADNLVEVEDLRIAFSVLEAPVEVVKGVSFRIAPGKTTALVGESGSGKSVISQAILGILPKSAAITGGAIRFHDQDSRYDLAALDPGGRAMRALRGGRMSMIFQEPMTSLSPLHTIGDQVGEALAQHVRLGRAECRARTLQMLGLVGFPDPGRAFGQYAFELSGGLRQRAMIAMALITGPALLIADEPTTALDVTIQAQILKLLRDLQARLGMAVLLITHDLGVVANMADEVVVIYHGEIMERGPARSIFTAPKHPYLKALMKAVPHFEMAPGERLRGLRDTEHTIGPLLAGGAGDRPIGPGTVPLVSVRGLTKRFEARKAGFLGRKTPPPLTAVDGVDLAVERGECLGLVGESGCGKTTLSKLLMKKLRPDDGRIILSGDTDVAGLTGAALTAYRRRVQMVFQDPVSSLSPRMTVFDLIREPLLVHGIGDRAQHRALVMDLMRAVGLDPRFLSRYPHSFSGGQRQRIGIARALALKPDMLICDEPVSALDVSVQAQILNLLKDLQTGLGLTYLFITHNLAVVNYIADRIAVMCRGVIVELAPTRTLFARPTHPYTQALLRAVPFPDLDRPLDFDRIKPGDASNIALWPDRFRDGDGIGRARVALGHGHWVMAAQGTTSADLAP